MNTTNTLDSIEQILQPELSLVTELIQTRVKSDVPLVNEISKHSLNGEGKRIRPKLVLLIANACNYQGDQHCTLAAIVELLHTATLLHDDVIDASTKRRHKLTAHMQWGNSASILAGDYLYALAFQLITELNQPKILSLLANGTRTIVEGELLQRHHQNNISISQDTYMQIIQRKTAQLFSIATHIGPMLCKRDDKTCKMLAEFGLHLGLAYQIIDDLLDLHPHNPKLGKNLGDDLVEGKTTLPLIIALENAPNTQRNRLISAIKHYTPEQLHIINDILLETNSLKIAASIAEHHIHSAKNMLSILADSAYKQALLDLLDFILARSY